MCGLAARPAPQTSKNAFVEAAKAAQEADQTRVFEFEDESLEERQEADDDLPALAASWRPVGLIAKQVHEAMMLLGADVSPPDAAAALTAAGHGVVLRRGLGPRDLMKAASTLRNEFVVLYRYGDIQLDEELIIEPQFRARFELVSGGTASYKSMLAALPDVFVGRLEHLAVLVQVAAAYVGHEYKRLRRDVPPWRTASALLSLWAPEHSRDSTPSSSVCSSVSGDNTVASLDSPETSPVGSLVSVLSGMSFGSDATPRGTPTVALKTVYGFDEAANVATAQKQQGGVRKVFASVGGDVMRVHSVRLAPQWFNK